MITPDFWRRNNSKIDVLHFRYASYRGVTKEAICAWLSQFESDEHAEVGLKILENINYYDQVRVFNALKSLDGLINAQCPPRATIKYCGFGYSGQSGPAVLREFRQATGRDNDRYQHLFIDMYGARDLRRGEHYLVMVDDVIGTGMQARGILRGFAEFVPDNVRLILAPITIPVSTSTALEREFSLKVISPGYLDDRDKIFSEENSTFTSDEKRIIRQYCDRAGSMPTGFGHSEMYVVFYTKTPNDTISILRCYNENWRGLFLRGVPEG